MISVPNKNCEPYISISFKHYAAGEQVVTVVGPTGQPMQVPVSAVLAAQNNNPQAMKAAAANAVQNMGI